MGGTFYSRRNFSDNVIKHSGRWKSEAFQTYIRLDNDFFAQLPFRALLSPVIHEYYQFGFNN